MNDNEKVELINWIIKYWEDDTRNLSYNDIDHPSFLLLEKIADKDRDLVIITILKKIEKELSWVFVVFSKIVPTEEQPIMPDEFRGKIQKITDMWLRWGKEKGYLNEQTRNL